MNRIGIGQPSMSAHLDGPKSFDAVVGNDRKQIAREDTMIAQAPAPEFLPQTREAIYAALGRKGLRTLDADVPVPEHRSTQPGRAAHAAIPAWRVQ